MSRTQAATLVFGAEIFNDQGTQIGEIQDLVVNLKSGKVIYAVISLNLEMGIEEKYYPVPIKALREDPQNEEIILEIAKKQLTNAPSFKKEEWPKEYNEEFVQLVYNHYGYKLPD